MKNWSKRKKILLGFFLAFAVAQVIQPSKNRGPVSGPMDITKSVAVPENVLAILKKSCYDCHSNNTVYPWYDNITPVNWWVAYHIDEGKLELNFTLFAGYTRRQQAEMMEGIGETVQDGAMPLKSYLLAHPDASLDARQKDLLVNWASAARLHLAGKPVL